MKRLHFAILFAIALSVAGCKLGPNYARPEVAPPATWVQPADEASSIANVPWWEIYDDPVLQDLIRIAIEENLDVRIAAARIEEARARYGFTRADQYPRVDAVGIASETDGEGGTYVAEAQISWELDIWGKYRRSTEAAQADLLATEEGRRAVVISLIGEVARNYFLLLDLDARLAIARNTLQTRSESFDLISTRQEGGVVSNVDVRQAEAEVARVASNIPDLERQIAQTENFLSVLLGRNPGPIIRGRPLAEQVLPPEIPAGLPSELLQRRPDILAAEQILHSQTALIGVAEALRWPSISLTGAFGAASDDLDDWFDDPYWRAGASLLAPIIDWGKNRNRVEVTRAQAEQALLGYRQTILFAFRDVEDALVAVRTLREQRQHVERQAAATTEVLHLAELRYEGGVTSYLEVLDSQREAFDTQLQASQFRRLELQAIVTLYEVLGGGWNPEVPQEQTDSTPQAGS